SMPLEHFQKMVFSGFFGVPKNSECHLYNKICITSLTFYSWSLTTVSQHFFSMGKTAANLLFDSIATGQASSGRIIRHELIKRHSVQMPSSTKTMD
ncbi:hypothetical protein M4D48_20785, partial [Alkalihalobacillus clausii]|nr:hypothetical protein [Shouchella clausii]